MGSNQIRRSGVDRTAKADSKNSGMNIDPGPYEAVVMNHVDGTRMGQLQVYIPELGGTIDDATNHIVVSYASPFYGTTYGTNRQSNPDTAATAGQSYGMWMVPPDLGCKVLVIFVAGDMSRGYWFACVYDSPSHHMVPGIARAIGGTKESATLGDKAKGSVLPVVEVNTTDPAAFSKKGLELDRYPHDFQGAILINQGLNKDRIRGAISSSSLRESPSNVYGISTPGRRGTKTEQVPGKDEAVVFRTGGHQFVMDDGDKNGNDQLVRLRTSGGHQILMNDKAQVLYIASASGKQWLEFSETGAINVYSKSGINMRTEGTLNLHSDAAVNIQGASVRIAAIGENGSNKISLEADGKIGITSADGTAIKTNGALNLSAMGTGSFSTGGALSAKSGADLSLDGAKLKLNCGGGQEASSVTAIKTNSLQNTTFEDGVWTAEDGALETICTVAPAHEPWVDPIGSEAGRRPRKK